MSLSVMISLISLVIAICLLYLFYKEGRQDDSTNLIGNKYKRKQKISQIYQKSYVRCKDIPLLRGYLLKIRKRLETVHTYDEYALRRETMIITFRTLGVISIIVLILSLTKADWLTTFYAVFAIYVVNGMLITHFVNRLEDKLLEQTSIFLEDVRHYFQQYGMVEEAIYEAAQKAPQGVSLHAMKIYESLISVDSKRSLEEYYGVAPNKYLKQFAYISNIIMENGDGGDKSLYLDGISMIRKEINFDVLSRKKTMNIFKGFSVVALAPIFFISFIQNWTINTFPILEIFYISKLGVFLKVSVLAIIVLCYFIIRKLQENEAESYKVQPQKKQWEKIIYKIPVIRWVTDRLVPSYYTRQHFTLSNLLKESNTPILIEYLYIQRLVLSILLCALTIGLFFYGNNITINNILYKPSSITFLGQMSEKEIGKALEMTDFDREIILKLHRKKNLTIEDVIDAVQIETNSSMDSATITTAQRIYVKILKMNLTYFKWWDLIIALLAGLIGYWIPVWSLIIKRELRKVQMKNEIERFRTLITILIRIDRMSVQVILEWLERSSVVFNTPLKKALLDYDSGATKVLNELKNEVTYLPFVRIIEKLEMAVDKIPLKDAFDDIEIDKQRYQEERKEHFERSLQEKAEFGMLVSLTPMMALVLLYLVFPMVYMSLDSMKIMNQLL